MISRFMSWLSDRATDAEGPRPCSRRKGAAKGEAPGVLASARAVLRWWSESGAGPSFCFKMFCPPY